MPPVPIILLTGFLGSGKTTCINWILEHSTNKKISVIVNEFGSIKLESQFIKKQSGDVMELANGCMCCAAKSDIPRIISLILERSPQTASILIEASGLSDPDPIKETLASDRLSPLVYLDRTICIIDGANFLSTFRDHPLILSQAADSDVLLLSKTTTSSVETRDQTQKILQTNIPDTPKYIWDESLTVEMLLTHTQSMSMLETDHHHLHEQFEEYWIRPTHKIDRAQIQTLFESLPQSVYRAKGCIQDTQGVLYLISAVGGKLTMEETTNPPEDIAVLLIGKSLNPAELDRHFAVLTA